MDVAKGDPAAAILSNKIPDKQHHGQLNALRLLRGATQSDVGA